MRHSCTRYLKIWLLTPTYLCATYLSCLIFLFSGCTSEVSEPLEESETLKVYEKESRINIVHVDLPECSEKEDHSSFNLDEDAFSNFTNDETEGPLEENSY